VGWGEVMFISSSTSLNVSLKNTEIGIKLAGVERREEWSNVTYFPL
jgi:hypothetical protein